MENEQLFSNHFFLSPFKWQIENRKELKFSERNSIKDIKFQPDSSWRPKELGTQDTSKQEAFNEKNFFNRFTHTTLFNENNNFNIAQYYERVETYQKEVFYVIHVVAQKENHYKLKLKSIGLNLYATGVGVLVFQFENYQYNDFEDIKRINQFGRKLYPNLTNEKGISEAKLINLADYISIEGLNGNPTDYYENFSSYSSDSQLKPSKFIKSLVSDFSTEIIIKPVVDDKMFVCCWYGNNEISEKIEKNYENYKLEDEWYSLLFMEDDAANFYNTEFRDKIIRHNNYTQWQKKGMLYGCTPNSLIFTSDLNPKFLISYFERVYVQLATLILVQKTSQFKFRDEVVDVSSNNASEVKLYSQLNDLYSSYIYFQNTICFFEPTSQEQGLDLYKMLQDHLNVNTGMTDLGDRIEKLHKYLSVVLENNQTEEMKSTEINTLNAAKSTDEQTKKLTEMQAETVQVSKNSEKFNRILKYLTILTVYFLSANLFVAFMALKPEDLIGGNYNRVTHYCILAIFAFLPPIIIVIVVNFIINKKFLKKNS
jgi:hypothetical protein